MQTIDLNTLRRKRGHIEWERGQPKPEGYDDSPEGHSRRLREFQEDLSDWLDGAQD